MHKITTTAILACLPGARQIQRWRGHGLCLQGTQHKGDLGGALSTKREEASQAFRRAACRARPGGDHSDRTDGLQAKGTVSWVLTKVDQGPLLGASRNTMAVHV
jgi:hypothetical protein